TLDYAIGPPLWRFLGLRGSGASSGTIGSQEQALTPLLVRDVVVRRRVGERDPDLASPRLEPIGDVLQEDHRPLRSTGLPGRRPSTNQGPRRGPWFESDNFGGRYWARTSDPQLVELVLSQLS